MNQAEWDIHWANWKSYLREHSLKRLRVQLRPLLKGKIADIGCGVTDMYRPGDDVTGVDISPSSMKTMERLYPFGTWFAADAANTGLPSNTFDVVLSSHVMEHFYDQRPLIEEMKRIVKPEGTILIAIPKHSVGPDHVHPTWTTSDVEDRIMSYLGDAECESIAKSSWLIRGKKTHTATVVMIGWSPDAKRLGYAQRCINTLKSCTKYPYTWVMVDNGPETQTNIVKQASPDIHIINKVNQRPPVARNLGAGGADTDYIAFVDNDVEFYEGWLQDAINMLEAYPNEKLIASPTDCKVLRRRKVDQWGQYSISTFGASTCWVMRRSSFLEIGPWNGHIPVEDYDYAIRAGMLGYRFIYREALPVVRHLGLHNRTMQVYERFINGRWVPDVNDKRGIVLAKRLLQREYAREHNLKTFIETTTSKGENFKSMLAGKMFDALYSLDPDPNHIDSARYRFRHFPNAHFHAGDPIETLRETLKNVNGTALIWIPDRPSSPEVRIEQFRIIAQDGRDHIVMMDGSDHLGNTPYPTMEAIAEAVPGWTLHAELGVLHMTKDKQTEAADVGH